MGTCYLGPQVKEYTALGMRLADLTIVDSRTWPFLRVHAQLCHLILGQRIVVFVFAVIAIVAPCQIEEVARGRFFCQVVSDKHS